MFVISLAYILDRHGWLLLLDTEPLHPPKRHGAQIATVTCRIAEAVCMPMLGVCDIIAEVSLRMLSQFAK